MLRRRVSGWLVKRESRVLARELGIIKGYRRVFAGKLPVIQGYGGVLVREFAATICTIVFLEGTRKRAGF
jgi:hypothetical protein